MSTDARTASNEPSPRMKSFLDELAALCAKHDVWLHWTDDFVGASRDDHGMSEDVEFQFNKHGEVDIVSIITRPQSRK